VTDKGRRTYEGTMPQGDTNRGATPQYQGQLPPVQGGVQPQHTPETGRSDNKPPAHE
jgi:hypothetical protein